VETALQSFFVSVPQAVAIWLLLLVGIAVAAIVVALPRKVAAAGGGAETTETETAPDPAAELAAAADRAAATAERRRALWHTAQDRVDEAWQAFDDADRAAREAAKAAAYPLLSRRRKPGENADRQRYLHHAAAAACRRREISIAQLNDVFAHRGWNPRLHPVQQEGVLRGAIREHLQDSYRAAVQRERIAWQEAERAAETLRRLRLEAAAAITRTGAGQAVVDERPRAAAWTTAELPAAA
jgi:hypothetical protein